jgi:hypothetical protein
MFSHQKSVYQSYIVMSSHPSHNFHCQNNNNNGKNSNDDDDDIVILAKV